MGEGGIRSCLVGFFWGGFLVMVLGLVNRGVGIWGGGGDGLWMYVCM